MVKRKDLFLWSIPPALGAWLLISIACLPPPGADKPAEAKEASAPSAPSIETAGPDWPTFRGDPRLRGIRPEAITDAPRLVWMSDGRIVEETEGAR